MTTLSHLTKTLEDVWGQLQVEHPDLPDVVIVVAPAGKSGKLGHFYRLGWSVGDTTRYEVAVSAEYLDRPASDLLTTLRHEGAHALAEVRKIKDTSTHGMYHNKRFAALAEEMGLRRPEKAHNLLGWSCCELDEAGLERDADKLELIQAAQGLCRRDPKIAAILAGPADGEDGEGEGGKDDGKDPLKGKALCACGDEFAVRIPKKALARGILCAVCGQEFVAYLEPGEEAA